MVRVESGAPRRPSAARRLTCLGFSFVEDRRINQAPADRTVLRSVRRERDIMSGADAPSDHILFERRGQLGLITLNRPAQHNALTYDMLKRLDAQLQDWATNDRIVAVAIRGAGEKAFCAGGDVRALYEAGRENGAANFQFYADEYCLNRRIKRFPKPYISFMDGLVMGGGVGVSIHGRYRVGGDRTAFAMPETGIGLFPDVGGSFFLSRLPNRIGAHLAYTGARLNAADCIAAHLIDYFVPSERTDLVIDQLSTADFEDAPDEVICEILALNSAAPIDAPLREKIQEIAELYASDKLDEVLAALDAGSDWAQEQAAIIRAKSPTSLRFAERQLRDGAELDFEDCMRLEYRLARACMVGPDFYEGVRAIIIDKDQSPQWSPATLAEVSMAAVEAAVAPLGAEELTFD